VNILQDTTGNYYAEEGTAIVGKFLDAIKNEDTLTFWSLMDRRGQGYFMGMWFYALGNTDLNAISMLAEDENFLKDALAAIVGELKTNLGELSENPTIGKIQFAGDLQALVPVSACCGPEGAMRTDHVPLVMELTSTGKGEDGRFAGNTVGMTCWKIDALKCFRVQKA